MTIEEKLGTNVTDRISEIMSHQPRKHAAKPVVLETQLLSSRELLQHAYVPLQVYFDWNSLGVPWASTRSNDPPEDGQDWRVYHWQEKAGGVTVQVMRDWNAKYNAGKLLVALYGGENVDALANQLVELFPYLSRSDETLMITVDYHFIDPPSSAPNPSTRHAQPNHH